VSEKSILSSFSASTRFQSVRDFLEVADFFILRCLPNGNDSDHFISLGMGGDNHMTLEQPYGNEPGFAIISPVIQNRDRLARKHLFDPNEVDSVLLNVGLPLRFIPLILRSAG
jgi:hypothetical protein